MAAELRRAIVLGELPPDEHLIEANLASSMQVSRGPVREALRQLEREALVKVNPNGRTQVVGISTAGIAQTYDTRICLESHALRLASARITGADIARLQLILDTASGAGRTNGRSMLNEYDLGFHRSFLEIGGNDVLLRLWETLSPQVRTLLEITNVANTHTESIADKHQHIVDALGAGDSDRAVAVLISHLEEAREVMLSRMAEVTAGSALYAGTNGGPAYDDRKL